MTPNQIEKAAQALRNIKRTQVAVEVLTNRRVVQITLDGDVALSRDRSGTGWASALGFPDDLSVVMTTALHQWANNKLAEARKEALLCGVTLDDETRI